MTDYAELRKLAEAATPGPYEVRPQKGYTEDDIVTLHDDFQGPHFSSHICTVSHAAGHKVQKFVHDSAFIAKCDPQTILSLLDEIERLRKERDTEAENCRLMQDRLQRLIDGAAKARREMAEAIKALALARERQQDADHGAANTGGAGEVAADIDRLLDGK